MVVIATATACSLPGSQVEGTEGLVGTHTVNGTDPEGGEYSGTVEIRATDRTDTFEVSWVITESILEGTATVDGDRVRVTWASVEGAERPISGTGTYTIDDEGNLVGRRIVAGTDAELTETIYQKA
ncbi:MAG: hypothetical protein R2746_10320 [Acidimicrobiales bacterium]